MSAEECSDEEKEKKIKRKADEAVQDQEKKIKAEKKPLLPSDVYEERFVGDVKSVLSGMRVVPRDIKYAWEQSFTNKVPAQYHIEYSQVDTNPKNLPFSKL